MISPVSSTIRSDNKGSGKYGARRHNRFHKGVDYVCKPGQYVLAPISGTITREAKPYANSHFSGALIRGTDIAIKMFYFELTAGLIGNSVQQGDIIGIAQDISKHEGNEGMTPHIHVEVESMNVNILINQL